jgi:hypothetical protein
MKLGDTVTSITKTKRPVTRVFVHCSADNHPKNDNAETMEAWHKARGWSGIGYHLFISMDGRIQHGRDLEKIPAAQEGNNTGTIAICMHGLYVKDFTQAQRESMIRLAAMIDAVYGPGLTYHGHIEVANKACPVYDFRTLLGLDQFGRRVYPPSAAFSPRAATRAWPGLLNPTKAEAKVALPAPAKVEVPPKPKSASDYKTADRRELKLNVPRGEDVAAVQHILGFGVKDADGIYGPRTKKAVEHFQLAKGMPVTGVVDQATWKALLVAS